MDGNGGGFLSKPRNLIIIAIVGVLAIGVFLARRGSSSASSTSATPQYIPTTGDTTVNYTYTQAVPASAPGAPTPPPASGPGAPTPPPASGPGARAQQYVASLQAANPGASQQQLQTIMQQQQGYVASLEAANPGASWQQIQSIMQRQQAYRASQGA